jgi:cytochrome c5
MSLVAKPLSVFALLGLAACSSAPAPSPGATVPEAAAAPATQRAPAAVPEETPASSGELTFSTEQADRGRDVFRSRCTECHYSSEFSDRSFKFKWRRRSAGDLFGLMSSTMPEDAPGSLRLPQYADLVAYVMRMNGFDPGSGELPADEATLDAISLAPLGN